MKKKVVFILGPTAVGKTYFSVMLAKAFDGEIISADSVQIYKGFDIGSAKVTKDEMQGVKHYAIDILEPEEDFSVFDFVQYTREKIDQITEEKHLPIVVGGTALYIKALTKGYNFGGAGKDENLRKSLEEKPLDELCQMLKEKDEKLYLKIDLQNKVRVVRALEIALADGEKTQEEVDIEPLLIALVKDRQYLYEAINKRVDIMLENGLVDEVKALMARGLNKENSSMKAIGYKEVFDYLNGDVTYEKMVEILKQHSRNYAKRQLTFLRSMDDINFVDVSNLENAKNEIFKLVGDFLK